VIVFVITYCQTEDDLWGNLLVFDSIRTGFPTSKIVVVDNGSKERFRLVIGGTAMMVGAEMVEVGRPGKPKPHDEAIQACSLIAKGKVWVSPLDQPWVLVDPDTIFYEEVERWEFNSESVLAGAWIPGFEDEASGCWTYARLHTSFLWVLRPKKLEETITALREQRWDWEPWRPVMVRTPGGRWDRWDTGSQLLPMVPFEQFDDERLDAYSHVIGGTDSKFLYDRLGEDGKRLQAVHELARTQPDSLRGLWREQLAYFQQRGAIQNDR
jgi:hypothetical protein